MALYMIEAKYKEETIRSFIEQPQNVIEREKHMDSFYGGVGARVDRAYFMRDAEHSFVVIVDFPDEQAAHAALLVGLASGSFENARMRRLITLEQAVSDFQRAQKTMQGFSAPGTQREAT
jgi:uncharacterized protein with GYD domain